MTQPSTVSQPPKHPIPSRVHSRALDRKLRPMAHPFPTIEDRPQVQKVMKRCAKPISQQA